MKKHFYSVLCLTLVLLVAFTYLVKANALDNITDPDDLMKITEFIMSLTDFTSIVSSGDSSATLNKAKKALKEINRKAEDALSIRMDRDSNLFYQTKVIYGISSVFLSNNTKLDFELCQGLTVQYMNFIMTTGQNDGYLSYFDGFTIPTPDSVIFFLEKEVRGSSDRHIKYRFKTGYETSMQAIYEYYFLGLASNGYVTQKLGDNIFKVSESQSSKYFLTVILRDDDKIVVDYHSY